jgi:hypothetical protein
LRYLASLVLACALTAFLLWAGAKIASIVSSPESGNNDFTVGQRMYLCGYQVDSRYAVAGYDLEEWKGDRCRNLSTLDRCILGCLEKAGTVETASACYANCVERH